MRKIQVPSLLLYLLIILAILGIVFIVLMISSFFIYQALDINRLDNPLVNEALESETTTDTTTDTTANTGCVTSADCPQPGCNDCSVECINGKCQITNPYYPG